MKHILNDLSDSEKNRILEQYENSILVETKKFNRLLGAKLGNVKPLINERDDYNRVEQQHLYQTHSPYPDYWDEFPFPEDYGSEKSTNLKGGQSDVSTSSYEEEPPFYGSKKLTDWEEAERIKRQHTRQTHSSDEEDEYLIELDIDEDDYSDTY